MVTLNALALLNAKGKTKYWLYQQLGMSYRTSSKMNNQTKSDSIRKYRGPLLSFLIVHQTSFYLHYEQ